MQSRPIRARFAMHQPGPRHGAINLQQAEDTLALRRAPAFQRQVVMRQPQFQRRVARQVVRSGLGRAAQIDHRRQSQLTGQAPEAARSRVIAAIQFARDHFRDIAVK